MLKRIDDVFLCQKGNIANIFPSHSHPPIKSGDSSEQKGNWLVVEPYPSEK
jgi:hypothetical protein